MPREAWTDSAGGFRHCRETLASLLPQLTATTIAEVLDLNPDWYRRIETGQQGVSIATFAILARAYLGLLDAFGGLLSPARPASLHTLLPEVPAPTPFPPLPVHPCPDQSDTPAYWWRIRELRIELARQHGMNRLFPARQIALPLRAAASNTLKSADPPRANSTTTGSPRSNVATALAVSAAIESHPNGAPAAESKDENSGETVRPSSVSVRTSPPRKPAEPVGRKFDWSKAPKAQDILARIESEIQKQKGSA
jgi:hypothetical protein